METKRFQLDLSEKEHAEMERLMAFAGIKTKREFISNAVTMFRWAAMELLQGRKIGSFDDKGQLKQLEMPALQVFSLMGLEQPLLSAEELKRRAKEPAREGRMDNSPTGASHERLATLELVR